MVGALGGLLFGFDTAVIAGTTQQLSVIFELTPSTLGFTVFVGLVGTVIGALCSGVLGQKIGGREALRLRPFFTQSQPLVVRSLGLGICFLWPASSVDWGSAAHRCSDLSISPNLHRRSGEAAWWVFSDQHRGRHPASVSVESHHRDQTSRSDAVAS